MKKFIFKPKRHPEDDLAIITAEYLQRFLPENMKDAWWHVPNGGKRNVREAARLKRMGVRAGVVDLHFCMPKGQLAVIELKVRPNGTTKEQDRFMGMVADRSQM